MKSPRLEVYIWWLGMEMENAYVMEFFRAPVVERGKAGGMISCVVLQLFKLVGLHWIGGFHQRHGRAFMQKPIADQITRCT